jgi:hypothetical protein
VDIDDDDERVDLLVTDDSSPNYLYLKKGDGTFQDASYYSMGFAEGTYPFLSWGTEFFDYYNDGWKDLMFVSGHVYPQVDRHNWGTGGSGRCCFTT